MINSNRVRLFRVAQRSIGTCCANEHFGVVMQHNRALVGSSGVGGGSASAAAAADVNEAREYAYEIKASSFKYGPGVIG
jgi:hypothetical protein